MKGQVQKVTEIPKELNWVHLRANCNFFKVFKDLEREITEDVAQRMSLIVPEQNNRSLGFKTETVNGTIFSVYRSGVGYVSVRNFKLDGNRIVVSDENNKNVLEATVLLDDFGNCCLRVGVDAILTNWQFRRRALEDFFVF